MIRCRFHWEDYDRWQGRMRGRRKSGGLDPNEPYEAEPAPDLPGQKWLTAEEATQIEAAMSRANNTLTAITNAYLHNKPIARKDAGAHVAATTSLLEVLRTVIWREGGRPPTWRERNR